MNAKLIGRYQITGEIGFGGMGAVYQAEDTTTGDLVAVKLLSPEYLNDLGLRTAFEREAQIVTSLEHEAIVPVYEFGQDSGQPYLVMEYMSNGSLAEKLLLGVLSPEEFAPILDRLCRAIDYAHKRGIIHRDLKPSNILFDEADRACLADFGIARQTTAHQAATPFDGTPAYLSPEQVLEEKEVDGRSDIYALGVILFETLSGQLPFDGQIPLAVILKHIHDQPPSLKSVDWNMPTAIDDVIQRALAKDPNDRFETAGALYRAYQLALSGESDSEAAVPNQPPQSPDQRQAVSSPESMGGAQGAEATSDAQTHSSEGAQQPLEASKPDPIDFFRNWQASSMGGWRWPHFFSLALVTFLGILIAAGLTAFIYFPQRFALLPARNVGFQLSYDSVSLLLTNHSHTTLDLAQLSFQSVLPDGKTSTQFMASRWAESLNLEQPALKPGDCYQLLLPDANSFSIKPGKPLPDLPGCNQLRGWLIISEPQSWFWKSSKERHTFEILMDGKTIQTCEIEAGSCQFTVGGTEEP